MNEQITLYNGATVINPRNVSIQLSNGTVVFNPSCGNKDVDRGIILGMMAAQKGEQK